MTHSILHHQRIFPQANKPKTRLRPGFPGTLFAAILLFLGARAFGEQAASPPARAVRRSDVVFMYDDPSKYELYGCTVLGWAGRADKDHIAAAHAAGVRMFATSVGFLTEGRGVMDFSDDFLDAACRNFAGEPFVVPWLWDHKYKDHPYYWWCTNSPLYRKYLISRLEQTMAAEPDGLHIDDYRGTSGSVTYLGGCFCRYCMIGFRHYLAEHVAKERLASLGIRDLARFDYRQFLLDRGYKPEEYLKKRTQLPLAAEFYDFQVKAADAWVAEYRRMAEKVRGKPLALGVNSGLSTPHNLVIAPQLSYFCCEVSHDASRQSVPLHPVYIYKLADGLDRPVTSTASGQDWAYVYEHQKPCLVRTWIALSYALGHNLMAPHRQWCYTKEKGTHWYQGPTEEYAYLYRFVRYNARLLDDYEAVAPVAVVYDNAANRQAKGQIEPICAALAQRNIPFTVVVAGDDWLDYRLDEGRMAGFRAVVVPSQLAMDAGQKAILGRVQAAGRLVTWPDDKRLAALVPSPVVVEGSQQVGVVPRVIPGKADAPVVLHLVNRQYDGTQDAMVPQQDFTVRLRRDLFDGRSFSRASLVAPNAEPASLEMTSGDGYVAIRVPRLDLWALVELTGSPVAPSPITPRPDSSLPH